MTEDKSHRRFEADFRNFTWPLLLIFSGVTLLLNNLDMVGWEVWNVIFHFWPLLLILAGIEYLVENSLLGSFLSFVVALLVLGFVFAFSISTVNSNFDRLLRNKYPFWSRIKSAIPQYQLKQKFFRCPPWQENCFRYNY